MSRPEYKRPVVGDPFEYKGRTIVIRHLGPDLLCEVDGSELGGFYRGAEAARAAGIRHVEHLIKEANKS